MSEDKGIAKSSKPGLRNIVVAVIQMCSVPDRKTNLEKAKELMTDAVQDGATLIALPENFSFMGPDGEKLNVVENLDTGPSVLFLKNFAAEQKVSIVGGSIPLKGAAASKVTNSCLVIDPSGKIVARYDKLHLFDIHLDNQSVYKESKYVEAGKTVNTVELFGIRMGLSICYDLRFPELYRRMTFEGAKIVFVPAAFTPQTGRDHWEVLLRARAIENLCYVVAPAQFGLNYEGRETYGRSMVIDPWGQVLVKAQDKPGYLLCTIDLEFLDKKRRQVPCLDHVRKDIFYP